MLLVDDPIGSIRSRPSSSSSSSSAVEKRRTVDIPKTFVRLLLIVATAWAPRAQAGHAGHHGASGGGHGFGNGAERIYEEGAFQANLPYKHTARCYSCMSKLYEAVWPSLSHIYKRPRNFTDDCDDDRIAEGRVPIVHCPTICVSLFEQPNIAGVRIKGYIRGCMSDVLINGFNQTIVTWYRWMHRDSCRPYRKKELFKLGGESADDSTIDVCTCYADHCNGNSAHGSCSLSTLLITVLTASYWLLL